MTSLRSLLRRILAPGLLLLLTGSLVAQPKIVVGGGTDLDFGQIYTGKKFSKNIPIYNIGADTLVILHTSASCGCTAAITEKDRIAPRDSTVLAITFNSSQYSGPVGKSVDLSTNDPAQKDVHIVFKAYVVTTFDLKPEYIVFKTTLDSIPKDTITLKNTSPFPVKILSATANSPEISAKPSPTSLKPGESSFIELSFKPARVGTVRGNLTISTDNEHVPSLDVRYFGLVTPKPGR